MKKIFYIGIFITILFFSIKYFKKGIKKIGKMVLSKEQEYFLNELHPSYKDKFKELISEINKTGWKVIITSGYRSFAKQAELKKENSKNATPGLSEHNYGLAIDINLINTSGEIIRKSTDKKTWEKTGIPKLAKSMGFKWGGESFSSYYDPVHFYIEANTNILLARAKKQFGDNPEKIKGNEVELG